MVLRLVSIALLCSLIITGIAAGNESIVCTAAANYTPVGLLQTETPTAESAATTCAPLAPDVLTAAQLACANVTAGQACLGTGSVQAAPDDGLIKAGDTVDIAKLDSLTGSDGSLALIKMQADLPEADQPIQMVLYGDATLTNAVTPQQQQPTTTITVTNGPANILNLRDIPDQTGNVVTTMKWGQSLPADGISGDGMWYRVQTDKGAAWVLASLVKVKAGDDASTLAVLSSTASQPMQSVTLQNAACGAGLLVQAANKDSAHLEINGARLTFSTATLLVQSGADQALNVQVISGSTDVAAGGKSVTAKAGSAAQIAADAAPTLQNSYAFNSLVSAPLDLLPNGSVSCQAGVTDGTAALYSTPGGHSVGTLDASSHATITGQTTVNGTTYYWTGTRWIAQNDVTTVGLCQQLPQVSPQMASQPSQTTSFANNYVPPNRSLWMATSGADQESGTCIAPPIAQCSVEAVVSPQSNGSITWNITNVPAVFTLRPSGNNTFSGDDGGQLSGASVNVTVVFNSPTSWVATEKTVYDNDPGCTHTIIFTAVPNP